MSAATEILRAFEAAWRDRDMTALEALLTEDVIYRASVGPEPGHTWQGRAAVLAGIAEMMESETGTVRSGPRHVAVDGESVTAIWYHMDETSGTPVPREIGCDIFRLRHGRIAEKDAYRKVRKAEGRPLSAPPGDPSCRTVPYHQRHFRPQAAWDLDGFHVKPYLISARPDGVESDLVAKARDEVARRVADARELGGHRETGYAILHRGTDAIWLLFNWWAFGEIVCQTLSYAQPGDAAARQGQADAEDAVATLYAAALGVERDHTKALYWWTRAAKQSNAQAQNELGTVYAEGLGVERNYGAAAEWLLKSARQGNTEAQDKIAILYAQGLGVAKDDGKAAEWWLKAAQHGHGHAAYNIGVRYAKGLGVEQDYEQARRWWLTAAQKGEAKALENLGVMYAQGDGVARDGVEAYRWLTLAVAAYPPGEKRDHATKIREAIAAALTPDQIETANRLITRWEEANQ